MLVVLRVDHDDVIKCSVLQMTALGKPELLQHLSLVLNETRSQFGQFNSANARPGGDGADTSVRLLDLEAFIEQGGNLKSGMSRDEVWK